MIAETPPRALAPRTRIEGLDIMRGLVIALMALDHVRDYFHASGYAYDPLDPLRTTAVVYATRWVTHFCAPTFVFLAGVSAWLQGAKGKEPAQLSRFLLTRGLWLIVVELTVVGFAWAFWLPFLEFLQVIWAIGWSMVALAALVRLPRPIVLGVAALVIAGHNLLDPIRAEQLGRLAPLWTIIHGGGFLKYGDSVVAFAAYPILPWIGVMALGYGLGAVFLSENRDRVLRTLGGTMVVVFLVLRAIDVYGDPGHWRAQASWSQTVMAFMNVQKYPPSLLYVCATLGPMLLVAPLFNRLKGTLAEILRTYGAVPLMVYVCHIYIVHLVALAAHAATGQSVDGMFNTIHDFLLEPQRFAGTGFPIGIVYLAWLVVLAAIFPIGVWWGAVKRRRRD